MSNEHHRRQTQEELILFLYSIKAIRIGNYTLSSGLKSSFYVDLRVLQSYPTAFRKAIYLLKDLIYTNIGINNFDFLCSIPTSGTVFGAALCYELFKPHIYIRKESKDYGTKRKIEGDFKINSKVLFIDDVATTGKSIMSGIELLAPRAVINDILVLVDRGQGSKELFESRGYNLRSAISMHTILEILNRNKNIDKNDFETLNREIKKN